MGKKNPKKAFDFIDIIERSEKKRNKGITMLLDKGLGLNQASDLMQADAYIDLFTRTLAGSVPA